MNKPFSRNFQNRDKNKTVSFGVHKCYWSGDKTHFEKPTLKICTVTETEKVQS